MEIRFCTKEDTTPNGKKYLFIHACREDEKLRKEIFEKIFSHEQGFRYCLWYADDPGDVFTRDGKEKLSEMSVFIPLVTEHYFRFFTETHPDISPAGLFESLQQQGTDVLPLLEEAKLIPGFNRIFGELHGIALSLPGAEQMIEEQLKRLLSDDELEERITREAFTGKLFLSYRKKDIKEAKEIMKAVHDTDAAGAAAIWFDEFLVAGRNFNDDILDNLSHCDAMALAVTPHLLEEGNYVRETEYKEAVNRGIHVLPVEAVRTDDDKLEEAFPGIGPRADLHDRQALEGLLEKAGFHGAGSRSAFGEYLLGMAFFIPVNVEKDVQRAIRLFEISAGHDCVEACEQLSRMYVRGVGVKHNPDKAIDYKLKAYRLLMKENITQENIRHLNRLLYDFDGLPLLLKDSGRVSEANEMQEAFHNRIAKSPFRGRDEFILYRVNALTDLANLFYEYDLDSGSQKNTADTQKEFRTIADILNVGNNTGPSEGRLNRAKQYADAATALLDSYHGKDEDMASFLRVVTYNQYADLSKYSGDLDYAIYWKEKAREIIEPLAIRTGNLEYMDRSFEVSNNLGLFYREASMQPAQSAEQRESFSKQSVYNIDMAVSKARQLENLSPDFRGRVVHALSNRALVTDNPGRRKDYALDCYDTFLQILKDLDVDKTEAWTLKHIGGEFSSTVQNIKLYTKKEDRKPVFEKIYGEVPKHTGSDADPSEAAGCLQSVIILILFICIILQVTGLVNITGFMEEKLGPHGTWIGIGILGFLYLLTSIPRRKK